MVHASHAAVTVDAQGCGAHPTEVSGAGVGYSCRPGSGRSDGMTKSHDLPVIVAGGGIGGLSVALTLHQIGVRARLREVAELKPLGVGIDFQPNAVRQLYDSACEPKCSTRSVYRPGSGRSSA